MTRRNFMITAGLSACLCATGSVAVASNIADDTDVRAKLLLADAWIETQLAYDRVPGASFALVHDQELVWAKGYGFSNLKTKSPATPDTKYSICSVSKLFTSIAVMQLRDAGRVSIDSPLSEILDWYDLPPAPTAEEAVTLRAVLSHVAGLPREAATPYWTEVDFPGRDVVRTELAAQQPLYNPYDRFQYSNLGMTLAGEAVAATSGQDYHTYVKANILRPLGLKDTHSELPEKDYGKSMAVGYMLPGEDGTRPAVDYYPVRAIAPAAGYASTVRDLGKFASWQFRLLDQGGENVLKATTLREMQRVHWVAPDFDGPAWGLGFAFTRDGGNTFVGHGGYCPGYRTAFLMRRESKVAVIAMVNVNDVSPSRMARILYGLTAGAIAEAANGSDAENGKTEKGGKPRKQTKNKDADYSVYQGRYTRPGFPTGIAVGAGRDGLFMTEIYSSNPVTRMRTLVPVEDHIFRVIDTKGREADTVRFEVDDKGRPVRLWRHGNYLERSG